MSEPLVPCVGCRGLVPAQGIEPDHAYVGASPGCWSLFTETRGREAYDERLLAHGRSITDAYMVQHPGVPGRQSSQSVWVHLVGLYLVVERGLTPLRAIDEMRRVLGGRPAFEWLDPPPSLGATTVVDAHLAVADPEAYVAAVRRWADDAWAAWSAHHDAVRDLAAGRAY